MIFGPMTGALGMLPKALDLISCIERVGRLPLEAEADGRRRQTQASLEALQSLAEAGGKSQAVAENGGGGSMKRY